MTRRRHIRAVAQRLLNANGVDTAPVPVKRLAEAMGAQVRESPADDSLSGFLLRNAAGPAIIGVNSRHGVTRRRFTIAHELGHFLLHGGEELHVDRQDRGFQIKLRNQEASAGTDPEEIEANVFAAEVLMPAHLLSQDLASGTELDFLDEGALGAVLEQLAEKYQVSKQALSFRLVNLGYVDH